MAIPIPIPIPIPMKNDGRNISAEEKLGHSLFNPARLVALLTPGYRSGASPALNKTPNVKRFTTHYTSFQDASGYRTA